MMDHQLTPKTTLTPNLVNTIQELSTSLKNIAPTNSEVTQIITYTLIATAITGIFVYHYIKNGINIVFYTQQLVLVKKPFIFVRYQKDYKTINII